MTKAKQNEIVLKQDDLQEFVKHINNLKDANTNLYEMQDIYLSDIRNMDKAISYLIETIGLCRQKDSSGNPSNYMDVVLPNHPNAWRGKD